MILVMAVRALIFPGFNTTDMATPPRYPLGPLRMTLQRAAKPTLRPRFYHEIHPQIVRCFTPNGGVVVGRKAHPKRQVERITASRMSAASSYSWSRRVIVDTYHSGRQV